MIAGTRTGRVLTADEQGDVVLRPLYMTYALIAVASSYCLLAMLADLLTFPGSVTAIWPASGLAAAAAIVFGYKIWPGILIGVYLNQMSWFIRGLDAIDSALFWSEFLNQSLVGLSYAAGNCLEVILIAYLVRRYAGTRNPLSCSSDVVRFIVLAALASPVVGSLSGTLVTCGLWGWTPWSAFWPTLWTWWVSAAVGILVVTPPLLFLHYKASRHWVVSAGKVLEGLALVGVASAIAMLAFYFNYRLEYLLLPILLWAAFRFDQGVTSWLGGALMLVAIYATTRGYGPFAVEANDPLHTTQALTLLQCFTATLIGTAMVVAAIVADRRRASDELIKSNSTLERRVLERTRELKKHADEARRANLAKSRFLAAASHDLRQPLHAVRYFVEALHLELTVDSIRTGSQRRKGTNMAPVIQKRNSTQSPNVRKLQQITHKIYGAVDNMRGMFDTILDISQLDANVIKPNKVTFPIQDLANTIDSEFTTLAQDRKLVWHCNCDKTLVHSDPVLLERILRNLLDNALKFTTTGTIKFQVKRLGSDVELSISDTGNGIPVDHQQVIFDEFYQFESTGDSKTRGLGLGLSIVRQLCKLLGHELVLQSTPGVGTTVKLLLEAVNSDTSIRIENLTTIDTQTQPPLPLSNKPATVLLLDDSDSAGGMSTDALLQSWGYFTKRVHVNQLHGAIAPASFQADVLIVKSPLFNQHIRRCRDSIQSVSADHAIPIIVIGGRLTDSDVLERAYYVSDPVKPAQLRSTLRACLRKLESVDS